MTPSLSLSCIGINTHTARRRALAQQLGLSGADEVAIIPSAVELPRNRDNFYPFRQDSYFFYLSGFNEPGAYLVIDSEGRTTLFCQPKDEQREIWDGYRLGVDAAPEHLGIDAAHSSAELERLLPPMLQGKSRLWWPFDTADSKFAQRVHGWLSGLGARQRPAMLGDLCSVLDEMRLVKDEHELRIMRRAAQISAGGHVRAMRRCAQSLSAKDQLCEYHLHAELLHEFRQSGAQDEAYPSIVAAGSNACVLHYRAGNTPVRSGDLVLIDAGCELDGYAADITRTFPANGRFTAPQRDVYELVLAGQQAAIDATRPGATLEKVHQVCLEVLVQGMLDLGLLSKQRYANAQDVIESKAYMQFFMHRTGHWLGMDVHDCGRTQRVFEPGMCFTIEPGIYVRPAPDVPERFHNIGIRIEDDAVVTAEGCELTTRDVPVQVQEIEDLWR